MKHKHYFPLLLTLLIAHGVLFTSLPLQAQEVKPLLPCNWGQGYPFYNDCPKDQPTGYVCKAGCVATAVAQVLYYHRRQGEAQGKQLMSELIGQKRYTYTDSKGNHITLSLNLANTTFDWADMRDTYVSNTEVERQAVAKFVYACGVLSQMIYSANVSVADPGVCAAGLTASFRGITARVVPFSASLVRSEITAGRPVIYSGNDGKGNAHAFVLDGINAAGQIHCNMGYNGSGDGYYAMDNLGNFPNPQNLLLISTTDADKPTVTPVSDLNPNHYAQASSEAATSIDPNQWYVLWNAGRGGAPMSSGVGQEITNASIMPGNEPVKYTAAQMVRFVPRTGGGYYIQTGRGDYLGNFSSSQGITAGTTSGRSAWFQVETIKEGYFALKSMGTRYLDTNGPGSTVVGWGTEKPTTVYSNSSWQIFPVKMQATPFAKGSGGDSGIITDNPFDGTKYYKIKNTGYSQGYLVAISATDTEATLRGVTQLHASGLYSGAHYQEPVDIYNPGTYWTIEATTPATSTTPGIVYLKNVLTGRYLAASASASQVPYNFQGRTSLHYNQHSNGTYWFKSTQGDDMSYLCAATHLPNPAAFWTISDAGSQWAVEEVTSIPFVEVHPTSITLTPSQLTMALGTTATLTATLLPENATQRSLSWSSSDESVVTVTPEGLLSAHAAGTAEIVVISTAKPSLRATCQVSVLPDLPTTDVVSKSDPLWQSGAQYLISSLGSGQYLVATPTDGQWTLSISPSASLHGDAAIWTLTFTSPDGPFMLQNAAATLFLGEAAKQGPYTLMATPRPLSILTLSGCLQIRDYAHTSSYLNTSLLGDNGLNSATSGWVFKRILTPTGLHIVPSASSPASGCYDLQGRPATQPQHAGLYIINHQKILRK